MSTIDDGGPAFPWGENGQILGGMSLRDWFAGQALAGIAKNLTPARLTDLGSKSFGGFPESFAAYGIADAMLDARKGGAK